MSQVVINANLLVLIIGLITFAVGFSILDFIMEIETSDKLQDEINHVVDSTNKGINIAYDDLKSLCGAIPNCTFNGVKP